MSPGKPQDEYVLYPYKYTYILKADVSPRGFYTIKLVGVLFAALYIEFCTSLVAQNHTAVAQTSLYS
jgi:hypothetical protein